jgi:hypothetical protein
MRKIALLVGAKSGTVGPVVTIDRGVWEVEYLPLVVLYWIGDEPIRMDGSVRFNGKCRISASVREEYKGPPIHLDIVQVGQYAARTLLSKRDRGSSSSISYQASNY